jgi:DHA2 family multidrug resistance protein
MALFTLSMWDLGHLTTLSGEMDTRFSLIIRGLGLGFLFTPINVAAFSSLKGAEIAQGAGLINLARQLGGSFGIAYLNNYITQQTAFHRNVLVTYLYPQNPIFYQRMQAISQGLMHRGYSAAAAQQAALGILNGTVEKQALTMSFNDAFLLIGLCVVFVAPAALLLRVEQRKAPSSAEMAH